VRQAQESSDGYEEFLLNLTEIELQVRKESRLKRLLRDAKFPLLKTLEGFDLNSAPGLDGRLLKELSEGQYIRKPRNIILLGKSGTGNYRKFLFMERSSEKDTKFGYFLMKIFP